MSRLIVLAMLLVTGCNTINRDFAAAENLDIYLNRNEVCFSEWDGIINEWAEKNGPINNSVVDIQLMISADGATRFSKLVKMVWMKQSKPNSQYSDLEISSMFEEASEEFVSSDCRGKIWVNSIFRYGNSPQLYTDNAQQILSAQATPTVYEDDRLFAIWLLDSILRK